MQSEKALLTAEELLSLPDTSNNYELIEGKLIKMPPGNAQHGVISLNLAYLLKSYVDSSQLGRVFGQDTGFILRRNPDTVLAPDVAFVAKERLPEKVPAMFLELLPDLVAEVVSPNDRPREAGEGPRLAKGWSAVRLGPLSRYSGCSGVLYRGQESAILARKRPNGRTSPSWLPLSSD